MYTFALSFANMLVHTHNSKVVIFHHAPWQQAVHAMVHLWQLHQLGSGLPVGFNKLSAGGSALSICL